VSNEDSVGKTKHDILPNKMFHEYFAGRSFLRDTHEILQVGMTLHLPVMCSTHGSFVGKLLVRHMQTPLVHSFKLESSHSLTLIPYN